MELDKLFRTVLASLMAALTAVGSYIYIPIGPVPIVLSTLFVLLCGLLLGSRWGLISMLVYLFVGAIGIPVFSGGRGGLPHFFGPTGGYLLGYAVAAWVAGAVSERFRGRMAGEITAVAAGTLCIYLCGVPWLKAVTQMPWTKALMAGMAPFLIGDVFKAVVAVFLARAVRPVLKRTENGMVTLKGIP
jgi:biotin transport system substrate-specific component